MFKMFAKEITCKVAANVVYCMEKDQQREKTQIRLEEVTAFSLISKNREI